MIEYKILNSAPVQTRYILRYKHKTLEIENHFVVNELLIASNIKSNQSPTLYSLITNELINARSIEKMKQKL